MTDSFEFASPDLFTAGTIGPPGQRVFYLQARQDDTLVTLKCEKEQVRALAEYLGRLLERLSAASTAGGGDLALVEPATPAWTVGSIGVGYDEASERVVLVIEEAREQDEEETEEAGEDEPEGRAGAEPARAPEPDAESEETEDEESDRASGRVRLTGAQVAAFVERARRLVDAGRPTCRLCGRPMNAGGHKCARTNGHGSD